MGSQQELNALCKNGSELPVEISLSQMGTRPGFLVAAAVRDVTARKTAETSLRSALLEVERMKERRTYVHMRTRVHVRAQIDTHTRTHARTCMRVCMHACMHACVQVQASVGVSDA